MALTLYNDLTRTKEPFVPLHPGKVGFYACGPTVYDYFHIGNARPFIVFDVLRRYLEHCGYDVTFVQNFTDIDDKMITRARELGISVSELAERFIEAYREDAAALGIRPATVHPLATEHVAEIIRLIEGILEKGHGYVVDGDVYFDVQSFPGYGKLLRQDLDELLSGARVEVDPRKKHPLDFALWKAQKPGEPAWDSPWGPGRPGWHIECSAMATKYLGETADIHSGGSDLVFPHHENEIAQAEAATGKPFVRFWIHNGYLLIDQEKMSKSLGNFLTAREARKRFHPLAIRLFMLSAHYRSPISFSEDALAQAAAGVERLRNCWRDLRASVTAEANGTNLDQTLRETVRIAEEQFRKELDDDFNTAGALGVVFSVVKTVNTHLKACTAADVEGLAEAERFFRLVEDIMGVLGIDDMERPSEDDAAIDALVAERRDARQRKDFARADAIRAELEMKGIILEDASEGTRWKRKL